MCPANPTGVVCMAGKDDLHMRDQRTEGVAVVKGIH